MSTYVGSDRQVRNDVSKLFAEHDAEQWSTEEHQFLLEFFDTDADALEEVSVALGRTIEACRQRYYDLRAGRVPVQQQRTLYVEYRGWTEGMGDGYE